MPRGSFDDLRYLIAVAREQSFTTRRTSFGDSLLPVTLGC